MANANSPTLDESKFIIQGIHLELTDALRRTTLEKAARLLRRNDYIVRIRIDIEADRNHGTGQRFAAKGRVEIGGPDLIAREESEDAYKSIDRLIDTLDSLLRERQGRRKDKRNHPHAPELPADLPKA